jgi:hypothetical protein
MGVNTKYRNEDLVNKVDEIAERILAEKRSNKYRDHFFPRMIDEMGLKIGAEIGVDKGGFSKNLLERSRLEKLYCIDCWMDNFGSDFKPDEYDPIGENRMKEAINTLSEFKDRTHFIKDFSLDASYKIEDNSLDFVYIDGDHSLSGIYTDIHAWIHKVKEGGILGGHDFKDGRNSGISGYDGTQLNYYIETVMVNFCKQYGFKLNVVGERIKSWWFVKTI